MNERERNVHSQSTDKGSSVPLEYLPSQRIHPTNFSTLLFDENSTFDRHPYRKRNNRVAYSHGFHCNPDTAPVRAKLSVPLSADTSTPRIRFTRLDGWKGDTHAFTKRNDLSGTREDSVVVARGEKRGPHAYTRRGPPARNRGHSWHDGTRYGFDTQTLKHDAEEISLGNEERFWQECRSSRDYKVLAVRQCRFFFLLLSLFSFFFFSSLPLPPFFHGFCQAGGRVINF